MNNLRKEVHNRAIEIDKKYADLKTEYGAVKKSNTWEVKLWQPLAQNVSILIFDKSDQDKLIEKIEGKKEDSNWVWTFEKDLNGFFYQYEITQENGDVTFALDPFAKSMAAFNWEGQDEKVGKAAFVDFPKKDKLFKLNKINEPQPIIYEAHVRDLTSFRKDVTKPGSFNALREIKFADHLNEMGITHIQFLPVFSCYALNELNDKILDKGDGNGWSTNYNWGYDPHNYFSLNGWFSSNPEDPYARMNEYKEMVSYFHENNIKVIADVVYNHMYLNKTLDSVIPAYYHRDGSEVTPVNLPALASERLMARRIVVESLKHFVEVYDVDGFRFDLSTFTDKETLEIVAKELRAIKPNLVLHGEAWNFTDLEPEESYNKGIVDNDKDFAYFNDTTRNAIKGPDDAHEFELGIIAGNSKLFGDYVASVVGNIKDFKEEIADMDNTDYNRFTEYPNNLLNYAACHDGHTLWDKVNLTIKGDIITKLEYYRQAILMQQLLQGRKLYLEGTEILYTKPADETGNDFQRHHTSDLSIDIFGLNNDNYHENSYRTTDYVNALRWEHAENQYVKEHVIPFFASVNKYLINTPFFNLSSTKEINDSYSFNFVSSEALVIDFNVEVNGKKIRVVHNFSDKTYEYQTNGSIKFDSKINKKNEIGISEPNSTILIEE